MSYKTLLSINNIDFSKKTVLIIGAGWMAKQYCIALTQLGIRKVSVISLTEKSAKTCCDEFGFQPYYGGYKKHLPELGIFDLVIVTPSVHELKPATIQAVECGNKNILTEKPCSLYSRELVELASYSNDHNARIRIAYNRLVYPSLWKLRELIQSEGGITSCRYTFTELLHTINFHQYRTEVYERWGIKNSLHVISMAHYLIGMPKEMRAHQLGKLDWHPNGAQFVGSGITQDNIPFSYHADWSSAGRWGIEIMTPENAYRLIPLEQLYRCKKGTFNWESVETTSVFPDVKQGVAEEVAIMLEPKLEEIILLPTLDKTIQYTKLAEEIFGYSA